jgi:hypothetical protein
VLRLVGQPLDGAVDALLDLRLRHALDAHEHLRQVRQARGRGLAARLAELGLDRRAVEVGHQLHGRLVAHGALPSAVSI